jgi:iron complex outermembrane receptor protein
MRARIAGGSGGTKVAPRVGVKVLPRLASALLLSTASEAALAQSASPGSTIVLDPVVVVARPERPEAVRRREGRRAAPEVRRRDAASDGVAASEPVGEGRMAGSAAAVQRRFDVLPGGVALVPSRDYADTANLTVAKALRDVPGVVVQDFFGGNDQPRIQIRGSGLQQNPVERGILMLQNGLPLNRADGSYIVGFADPRQAETIEVYRGYMANRLGATVLGGALNFVSPTGSSQPGTQFTASGGSFGQAGLAGQTGFKSDKSDGLFQFDINRRTGFRDYNSSERVNLGGNVGIALSENVSTRLFVGYTDLGFDVAGPLTKSAMYANPRQVFGGPTLTPSGAINPGPNVIRDRPRRDASQFLAGARTTATFDAHLFDSVLGYTYTKDTFRFPISSGVRTTDGGDLTGVLRYAFKPDSASILPLFETTAQYTVGSATRGNYINQAGQTGAKLGESDLDASTVALYAGFNLPVWESASLSPAISYAHATRANDDIYKLATRPTIAYSPANPTMLLPNGAVPTQSTSYARSYDGWSPSVGLSWQPVVDQTVFAAVSRSFEPPTHDDLLATVNGTPNSSPGRPSPASPFLPASAFSIPDLKAQTATTVESGWRGRTGRLAWDAVTYYALLHNELLSLRDSTGAPLGSINADKTRHFGIELGLGAGITDRLSGRVAYTYQDFRFVDDPVRGNNQLAGAPRHLINATLQYRATESWTLQGIVRWVPDKTPVDNMNTLYADPYAVVDLKTEYRIDRRFTLFGEITNLFNKVYASSTLIVDQARPDQAAFLPGDGRAFYAGIRSKL